MSVYIFTPKTMKDEIDKLAKDKGFKFFIISSEKNGTALAPSKKVPVYRIPCAMPEICKGTSNLSAMLKGFYFVGFTDETILDEMSLKEYENALKRERDESN
jgi:hypothetical protein